MSSNLAKKTAQDDHESSLVRDAKQIRAAKIPLRPDGSPDVLALMSEIRSRVKEQVDMVKERLGDFKPSKASLTNAENRRAGELLFSEELRFLNSRYAFSTAPVLDNISSHRPGIIGKSIVKLKRKIISWVWNSLLRDYFSSEQEFNTNLVRYLNDVAKYVDARDTANFLELIRKIDLDIANTIDRFERMHDEQIATTRIMQRETIERTDSISRELSTRVDPIVAAVSSDQQQLATLDSVVRGFESIIAQIGKPIPTTKSIESADGQPEQVDFSYLLLENRYRGSEELIADRMKVYADILASSDGRVLEIGCGRGELLTLLREKGLNSYGVDLDQSMVQHCQGRGLEVYHGDAIKHLASLADKSLAAVIAIQVVEHLPRTILESLIATAKNKVKKGGKVIFETINPQSVVALSSNYFRDPTHVWPLHPDTLGYQMSLAGLKILEVKQLSPIPEAAQLRMIETKPHMTPIWQHTVEVLNHNMLQLNRLLYGFQDYCIIAEVVD